MFTFDKLWKSHPAIFGDAAPCRTTFSDYHESKDIWFWKVI